MDAENVRCKECGGGVCICSHDETHWATHCMDYDNSIGKRGFYDHCVENEKVRKWLDMIGLNLIKTREDKMTSHTRETDEQLLIQFVDDQGFDHPDLVEAAERLKDGIAKGLAGYSVPIDDEF